MCTVCGCSQESGGRSHDHGHSHHTHSHDGQAHSHETHDHCAHNHGNSCTHDHENQDDHVFDSGDLHMGKGEAGVSVAGFSQGKLVEIEQNILSKNDSYADTNRQWLHDQGVLALNLVSSPGAGKTTLLVETLNALKAQISVGVVEGDQETSNDADRIRETGVPAIQINTGKGCHLDAHMVGHAMQELGVERGGAVLIENVGNLVCPAAFDLGEAAKVVILSVTEGEDKPIKYPDMFAAADLMILSKTDLLPHLDFDADQAIEYAHRVNPHLKIIRLSAKTGEGIQEWHDWIVAQATLAAAHCATVSVDQGAQAHA